MRQFKSSKTLQRRRAEENKGTTQKEMQELITSHLAALMAIIGKKREQNKQFDTMRNRFFKGNVVGSIITIERELGKAMIQKILTEPIVLAREGEGIKNKAITDLIDILVDNDKPIKQIYYHLLGVLASLYKTMVNQPGRLIEDDNEKGVRISENDISNLIIKKYVNALKSVIETFITQTEASMRDNIIRNRNHINNYIRTDTQEEPSEEIYTDDNINAIWQSFYDEYTITTNTLIRIWQDLQKTTEDTTTVGIEGVEGTTDSESDAVEVFYQALIEKIESDWVIYFTETVTEDIKAEQGRKRYRAGKSGKIEKEALKKEALKREDGGNKTPINIKLQGTIERMQSSIELEKRTKVLTQAINGDKKGYIQEFMSRIQSLGIEEEKVIQFAQAIKNERPLTARDFGGLLVNTTYGDGEKHKHLRQLREIGIIV